MEHTFRSATHPTFVAALQICFGRWNVGGFTAEMIGKMTAPHISVRPGCNDGADREKRIYVLEKIENTLCG